MTPSRRRSAEAFALQRNQDRHDSLHALGSRKTAEDCRIPGSDQPISTFDAVVQLSTMVALRVQASPCRG